VAEMRALRPGDGRLAGPVKPVYGTGECAMCGRVFLFNARKVPTFQALGKVCPICLDCMELANRRRSERQLPLLKIPPGAYEPEPS
jgi:hypothetical protein